MEQTKCVSIEGMLNKGNLSWVNQIRAGPWQNMTF